MTEQRTPQGEALTDLILVMFRANNRTLTWGDRLVAPMGLTSARWQVMGAITAAGQPQPVAWLARDLGANRQNVQRIVNDLEAAGLVALEPNPHHRRARLVVLTKAGQAAYDAVIARYDMAVNRLAEGIPQPDLETALAVLTTLRTRLEAGPDPS